MAIAISCMLITMLTAATLGEILGSWRRFTAREASRHLGRGRRTLMALWQCPLEGMTRHWSGAPPAISLS